MNNTTKTLIATITTSAVLLAATSAMATDTKIYDWPDEEVPVVVVSDAGLVMLNQSAEPLRVFDWQANEGERDRGLRMLDTDGDGSPNLVASGNPTFVTDSAGDPQFSFTSGCDQVIVADIDRNTETDLVCIDGTELRLYAHTGSRLWSVDLGRGIDWCHAGDLTGDTRPDIECKFRGAEQYIRFRPSGEVITDEAERVGIDNPVELADQFHPVDEAVWTGERSFDLDGDGTASETIQIDGSILQIHKKGEDEPIGSVETSGEIKAVTVANFNELEGARIVAVTDNHRLYVIGEAGGDVSDHSADPSQFNRVPHAEFNSVQVNGFEDNDAVRASIQEIEDNIASCYADRLRQAPFAGSGRLNLQGFVGDDGSVQTMRVRHSDVDDDNIENCVQNAVTGVGYPGADGPRAVVTVDLYFSFVDQE